MLPVNAFIKFSCMKNLHPQFITDESGKKVSVVLSIHEYKSILEELEELEGIRLYDEIKASNEESVPIEIAFQQIESKRK